MNRYSLIAIFFTAILFTSSQAHGNSDWFRHSAISPDGKTIAFSYQGDIYSVPTAGGDARPLTIHDAWEGHPVWSHDGKNIAFASDRHGNLDIFMMPATGGKARRLTFHSAHDVPTDFTPTHDAVLFSSGRTDSAEASLFPTSRLAELYQVPTEGGTPRMVSTIAGSEARYSDDGNQILYRDEKSYEIPFRKHDTSAFARNIWKHDLKSGKHSQLTQFKGGDHNPVWANDGSIYYLSEDGNNNFNVWKMDTNGKKKQQISQFDTHPVRHLSISRDGTLAFTQHGQLYTQTPGQAAKEMEVRFRTDTHANDYITTPVSSAIKGFAVSPNGKEIAFVARGEVFVTSRDFTTTRRVTNTPEQERNVSFHPDGRTLLYAGERGGKWNLYEATIADTKEKYFFTATKVEEKEIHSADRESFQPSYSPDGKQIAYLSGRDEIQVLKRDSGETHVALGREHNYSYSDGDIAFAWSPDSQWLIADYAPRDRLFITNIGIVPADGSAQPVDISHSGYLDSVPSWGRSGDVVYWASSRYGQRDHGSWGRELDIMATFLTQDAYDKFTLSKEEYELAKELREANEKKEEGAADKKSNAVKKVEIDWKDLDDRTVRLTRNSADITSAMLNEDNSKLYFMIRHAGGNELWERNLREGQDKLLKKMGGGNASFILSKDGKTLFFQSGSSLSYADVSSPEKGKPISLEAVMELKPAAERDYMFEHSWRQIHDKFYNPTFHGIDWQAMKKAYQSKLPSISNNRDFANLLAEMTGELNASHIGVTYRPSPAKNGDRTAALGVLFDLSDTTGPLEIVEILDKSPLKQAKSSIKPGMKLTAVDGVVLDGKTNLAQLLNHKTGKRVRLSIERPDGTKFDEVTKPISTGAEGQLLYERWVKNRRDLVDQLSNGRLGYVHIRGMNDASYRVAYSEILGQHFDKDAIIVDTRWNGGGWLHNDLAKLLSGKEYVTMHVRGREYRGDSLDQWNKPSIVVMGEGNYSDANGFPFAYRALKIGELVGMPVPGTMTAVWWETSLSGDMRVGVPQVGMKNKQGEFLENKQMEPDHKVMNDPESTSKGEDKQIARAVEVMLKQLDSKKKRKTSAAK
ncbi:MAG: PDZ domain-containing protein [Planctomycetaceae bacterium]|nr:PDZ domain-containing protein [Planctomycetaceae bacterium]